jgi:hypothetical protein
MVHQNLLYPHARVAPVRVARLLSRQSCAQAFPNSVNEPQFQNVIVRPGETYHHEVAYTLKASK